MYNENKTAMDLTRTWNGIDITEEGYRQSNGRWYINYSSILTALIQNTGRFCERFASDLFIDWARIDKALEEDTIETGSYFFGLRDSGVDHKEFIDARLSSSCYSRYDYRKIFRLDITVTEDPSYHDKLTFHLYEVD